MGQGRGFWLRASFSGLTAVLGVLTALWPDWIELTTGLDPDGGNGALEWLLVAVLLVVAVVLGWQARSMHRVVTQG